MKLFYCVTALLLFAASAFARIGETEAQIEARYGKPTKNVTASEFALTGVTRMYKSAGFEIVVTFVDGKSGSEYFSKGSYGKLDQSEVDTILAANAGKWAEIKADHPLYNWRSQRWILGDMSSFVVADFDQINGNLSIFSKTFLDVQRASSDATAREKLKGF
jgi:hypothetical protein